VLDDMALNRPLNLVFRLLRLRVLAQARSPIRAFGLERGATVAIVNWNSLDLLRDVVRALERFGPPADGRLRILVIDNGSTDGSRAWLRRQRRIGRLRAVLLSRNVFHGPAMDLAFLLASTEFVVALDVDAFPVTEGWLEQLVEPLRNGKFVSGAQALRGYIHPCCLAMRTEYFARRRHTFTPHVGTWDPDRLGRDEWDTGESITRREGLMRVQAFPRTRVRGPLQLGTVFGNFVYHNGASTRLRSDIEIDGLTPLDAEHAWAEAIAEFLDHEPTPHSSDGLSA
jgi:glycosyltransferase involved in cell wall biosynthesis